MPARAARGERASPAPARTPRLGLFSWMLFDWAAQPYFTLLITFIFAPYFAAHVAPDPVAGQTMWGQANGIGGLVIALLAPVLGTLADTGGAKKPWIAVFSVMIVIGAALLYLAVPGPGAPIVLVLAAYVLGLVGIEFATVFTNAMMPALVPRSDLGRLSGSGWALGYVGGVLSLVIVLVFMSANAETGRTLAGLTPILGLDPATHGGDRATGPLTALWYALFVLPLFLFTPDAPKRPGRTLELRAGLSRLGATLRALPRRRSYMAFLITSMLYRDGLNGLFAFGGIYAAGVLGMSITQVGVFGIVTAILGTLGAFVGGRLDARFGPRTVIFWGCWLLVLSAFIIVSTTGTEVLFVIPVTASSLPLVVFYVAGGAIGAAAGAVQAASRTLLVDQVVESEATEAFGLYALAGRATSFIAPFAVGIVTAATLSQRLGILPIIALLALGALGLFWVTERQEG